MSAKVAFLSREATKEDQQARIVINPAAVVGQGSDARVYRIVDGRARSVSVQLGQKFGDMIAVKGVKPSEKLIIRPLDRVRDGSKVKVAEK
jgi:hypothetical protein